MNPSITCANTFSAGSLRSILRYRATHAPFTRISDIMKVSGIKEGKFAGIRDHITVGSATLLRFYVLHVAVLPAIILGLIAIHLWRWRKDAMLDQGGDDA